MEYHWINEEKSKNKDKQKILIVIITGLSVILGIMGLASLFIVAIYNPNESQCENTKLIMDVVTYLCITAIVHILYFGACLFKYYRWKEFKDDGDSQTFELKYLNIGVGIIAVFQLVWMINGFVIYIDQMSNECQQENVGKMILSWDVVLLINLIIKTCAYTVLIWIFN